jgi:hypothetical protein
MGESPERHFKAHFGYSASFVSKTGSCEVPKWNAHKKLENVWQVKDAIFVSVAGKGVTGFLDLGEGMLGCR